MQQAAHRHPLPLSAGTAATPAGALLRAPFALLARLAVWQHQAEERAHLLRLSDHELHDLGISRGAAEDMARKPFWQR
ncbi:MAG: hypothetical protein Kow00114_09840 [Kiloniellaceae bacterium]